MTREERENALHCLKAMIDEEVCEECNLYGTTGTDHCEVDCVRVAIKALEQEPTIQEKQAESDRWQKAFEDGYENGYSQASFDCRQDFDKIRAEIEQQEKWLMIAGYNAYNADIAFNAIKSEVAKYKAEKRQQDED